MVRTWTMVIGWYLFPAATSNISLAFVPTNIFSPLQHTLRIDIPISFKQNESVFHSGLVDKRPLPENITPIVRSIVLDLSLSI